MAKAFSIGRAESDALFALSNDVSESVCAELERLVTPRGMAKFLNHDVIGKGTFSTGWTSGFAVAESWAEPCTNLAQDSTLATWHGMHFVLLSNQKACTWRNRLSPLLSNRKLICLPGELVFAEAGDRP